MIAATFARLEQAWNAADGIAFGAEFTDDAEFVDVRGEHHQGRAAIAAGHQAILDTVYRGSTVRYVVEHSRPLRPDLTVAVVHADLDVPTGPLAGHRRSRLTAVVETRDGQPAVTAFHNTLVAAEG